MITVIELSEQRHELIKARKFWKFSFMRKIIDREIRRIEEEIWHRSCNYDTFGV